MFIRPYYDFTTGKYQALIGVDPTKITTLNPDDPDDVTIGLYGVPKNALFHIKLVFPLYRYLKNWQAIRPANEIYDTLSPSQYQQLCDTFYRFNGRNYPPGLVRSNLETIRGLFDEFEIASRVSSWVDSQWVKTERSTDESSLSLLRLVVFSKMIFPLAGELYFHDRSPRSPSKPHKSRCHLQPIEILMKDHPEWGLNYTDFYNLIDTMLAAVHTDAVVRQGPQLSSAELTDLRSWLPLWIILRSFVTFDLGQLGGDLQVTQLKNYLTVLVRRRYYITLGASRAGISLT